MSQTESKRPAPPDETCKCGAKASTVIVRAHAKWCPRRTEEDSAWCAEQWRPTSAPLDSLHAAHPYRINLDELRKLAVELDGEGLLEQAMRSLNAAEIRLDLSKKNVIVTLGDIVLLCVPVDDWRKRRGPAEATS